MQQEDLASAWLRLSISGDFDRNDPFLRFVAAWLAFNSLYAEVFRTIDGDRRQVMAFAEDSSAQGAHSRLVKVNPEYVSAIGMLAEHGVLDLRTGRKCNIGSAAVLAEVLECVYQVRCNLIHGGKHRESPRDRALAHAGYVVVANLVTMHFTGKPVSHHGSDPSARDARA